jgi:hypothetical protein
MSDIKITRLTIKKNKTNGGDLAKQYVSIYSDGITKDAVIIHRFVLTEDFVGYASFSTLIKTFKDKFLFLQVVSILPETLLEFSDLVKNHYSKPFDPIAELDKLTIRK